MCLLRQACEEDGLLGQGILKDNMSRSFRIWLWQETETEICYAVYNTNKK